MTQHEEVALVIRAQSGDSVAISTLYRHFRPLIRRYARRMAGRTLIAADLEQAAAVELIVCLPQFDTTRGVRLRTWLHWRLRKTIGRSALKQWRAASLPRHAAGPLQALRAAPRDLLLDEERAADSALAPDASAIAAIDAATLWAYLARFLSEQHYTILRRRMHGETFQQIATTLGQSKQRIHQIEQQALALARKALISPAGKALLADAA
jgi:RNA polymerase sigma factor (sigma-70 family)